MYIKLLLRMIFGYVRIQVEGYYIERFINICTNKKMIIWNIKRIKGIQVFLNIGINDFKQISDIAKKTNCKVRIKDKKGIPFLIQRYKKRKIFAIFLLVIVILIFISSRYIWNIDISVQDNQIVDNMEEDLEKRGLKPGVLKKQIDTDKIINDIRLNRNDIAWMGIDIEGTNVKVKIVKAKEQPDIINNKDYCDIIAKKSGTITKITAQNGTAVVKVGDTVKVGDILIKGVMEGKYTEPRKVHSLGVVEAEIIYSKTKEIYFEQEVKNKYSLDEAIEEASQDLARDLEEELSNKESIINKNVKTIQKENSVIVTLSYKVIEEIGEKKK